MTPYDLSGAVPELLLSRQRGSICWVSGVYRPPSTFIVPVVWVTVVLSNLDRQMSAVIARVTLN